MVDSEKGRGQGRVEASVTCERVWGVVRAWGIRGAMAAALVLGVASEGSAGIDLNYTDIIEPPGASLTTGEVDGDAIVEQINLNPEYESFYNPVTVSDLGEMLFKWEQASAENNTEAAVVAGLSLSDSYSVSYTKLSEVMGADEGRYDEEIMIEHTGSGNDIVDPLSPSWLVVKDGNAGFVVYDLYDALFDGSFGVSWDGKEYLSFTNAGLIDRNDNLKEISHFQIWGGVADPSVVGDPGPPFAVPEPSSFAIWGVCLGALGLVIRRRMVAAVA